MNEHQIDLLKRVNELLIKKYLISPSFFNKKQLEYINSLSEKDICDLLSINPIILNLVNHQTDIMHNHILHEIKDVKILDKIAFKNLNDEKLLKLSKKSIKLTRKFIKTHSSEKFHEFAIEKLKKHPNEYSFFLNPTKNIKFKLIENYLPAFFSYYKNIKNKDKLSLNELTELKELEFFFTNQILARKKPTAFGIYLHHSLLNYFDQQNIISIYLHFLKFKRLSHTFNNANNHITNNVLALLSSSFNLDEASITLAFLNEELT